MKGTDADGEGCDDINECDAPDACVPNSDCTNEPATYSCACKTGLDFSFNEIQKGWGIIALFLNKITLNIYIKASWI